MTINPLTTLPYTEGARGKGQGGGMREIMQALPQEERAAFREGLQALSPEARQAFKEESRSIDQTQYTSEEFSALLSDLLSRYQQTPTSPTTLLDYYA